jgi:LacI family transcriptional regulator
VRQIGIREVAEHAGVAVSTVSNYLNHPSRVSEEKMERIQRSIESLGFVPNNVGRQLRLGESSVIAYIAPDISNPFFSDVAEGVERRATELGLSVFVANSHRDREREGEYLSLFERYRVRGIIAASYSSIEDQLARLRGRGTPSVLLGNAISQDQPSVSVDEVLGGRLVGDHLLAQGHRRIAFVGGPLSVHQVNRRLQGVSEAIRDAGMGTLEVIDVADRTMDTGREVGAAITARAPSDRPHAIFAVNDLIGLGLIQQFAADGIRVPDEIAVIGYDDIAYSRSSMIPLSSVHTPHDDYGTAAVDLLAEAWADAAPRHVVFEPELVARDSTIRSRRA